MSHTLIMYCLEGVSYVQLTKGSGRRRNEFVVDIRKYTVTRGKLEADVGTAIPWVVWSQVVARWGELERKLAEDSPEEDY